MASDVPPPPPPPPPSPPSEPPFGPPAPQPAGSPAAAAGRVRSAVVFGLALLFLGDTFLAWQRACVAVPRTLFTQGSICVRANAWHGTAAGMGVIAGIAAILLLTWEGAHLAGAEPNVGVERRVVTTILAGAVVVAAGLKWALVLGSYAGPGAWLGLLLAAALGGWVFMQQRAD